MNEDHITFLLASDPLDFEPDSPERAFIEGYERGLARLRPRMQRMEFKLLELGVPESEVTEMRRG